MRKTFKAISYISIILILTLLLSGCKNFQIISKAYEIKPDLVFELSDFGDSADDYIHHAIHHNGNLTIEKDNTFKISIHDYEYIQNSTSKTQTIRIEYIDVEGTYDDSTLEGVFTGEAKLSVTRTEIQQSSPIPADIYEYVISITGNISTYEETGYINFEFVEEFSYTYNMDPDRTNTGTYRHTISFLRQD